MPIPIGLIDFDGCGDGDRDLTSPQWSRNFIATVNNGAAAAWPGGYGCQIGIDPFNGKGFARRAFPFAMNRIVTGFHFKVGSQSNFNELPVIQLQNGANTHITIDVDLSESVRILDPVGAVIVQTANGLFTYDEYQFYELELLISDTVGLVRLWRGNEEMLEAVNIDTKHNSAPATLNGIRWANGESQNIYFDDWYLLDPGVPGAVLLGIVNIPERYPNADGTPLQWDPSVVGSHFEMVNERPMTSADYVSTSTDGEKELFGISDPGLNYVPAAVRLFGRMSAPATPAAGRMVLKDGSNYGNGVIRNLGAAALYYDLFATRPDGSAWSEAAVDAMQIGAEKTPL